ncbi:class I SAM-dependent methyltransferase [Alteromonas confluentis]|uniref:Methyltransferase type 11 domain-containing protein n=1 Tax=Alteromonas confluentis TaxID=1656094 RepID=A0A1E7ZAB8_9ALTE|nr:class I SAM-dependent methyltransferase [Alteromonas confluentis]OFC70417.1 hypothetical protein BFC18_14735 [Alteromonas confluentis]
MDETISYYSQNAEHFQQLYDSVEAESVHASWSHILKEKEPGVALDVGAGSGRDARWLASLGWKVVAVEPAEELRNRASIAACHNIEWSPACLPDLVELPYGATSFDLILLSAVWMHIPPSLRCKTFTRLVELLSRDGLIIISLRYGPDDPQRPMYEVSVDEIQRLSGATDTVTESITRTNVQDDLGRDTITWQTIKISKHA